MKPAVKLLIPFALGAALTGGLWIYVAHGRSDERGALEFLPPERIELNPDCGFAPGNAADIPLDEAYAKLCNEAAAARRLRERFSAGSRTGRSAPA